MASVNVCLHLAAIINNLRYVGDGRVTPRCFGDGSKGIFTPSTDTLSSYFDILNHATYCFGRVESETPIVKILAKCFEIK